MKQAPLLVPCLCLLTQAPLFPVSEGLGFRVDALQHAGLAVHDLLGVLLRHLGWQILVNASGPPRW